MKQMTEQEIEHALDELAKQPTPKRRVWEIDALRGFLILLVIFDHLMYDFSAMYVYFDKPFWQAIGQFADGYYWETSAFGKIRTVTHHSFIMMFILLSGISCAFSRNNLQRGVKMLAFGALFTIVTFVLSSAFSMSGMEILFNVIHVIALCVLIWHGLQLLWGLCKKTWQKNLYIFSMMFGIGLILLVGYYFEMFPVDKSSIAFIFVNHTSGVIAGLSPGDYLPLLPSLGWFLIGGYLGKALYSDKQTKLPSVNEKFVKPLTFLGRYSLAFYFGSQIVFYSLIYLCSYVLGWM